MLCARFLLVALLAPVAGLPRVGKQQPEEVIIPLDDDDQVPEVYIGGADDVDEPVAEEGYYRTGLAQLKAAFINTEPTNDLGRAGLMVHFFDFTEEPGLPWKPCFEGWCGAHADFWSTSIINTKQNHSISTGGIILNPKYVKVKCGSHVIINKKLEAGCDHSTFQGPEYVEKMLKYSMGLPEWGTEPIEAFNEVLVDSSAYLTNLPRSVEGFVMIGGPSESDQARLQDEPPATLASCSPQ